MRAGLSQEAFATELGFSRRAIINWEQGVAEPPISILPALRHLFDVDPEWVVMGEDLIPRVRFGAVDWERFDRIGREVAAACLQVGIEFEPQVHIELVRDLFDDDPAVDEVNRKQMHRTLRGIARGRSA